MSIRPRSIRTLTAVIAVGLAFVAPGTASAETTQLASMSGTTSYIYYNPCLSDPNRSTTTDGAATACFQPDGEHFYLCDIKADGHHPEADFIVSGWNYPFTNTHGYGTCLDANFDMNESIYVAFRSYNYEGNTLLSAGPWRYDYS